MSHSWVERIVDEYVDSLCLQKGYEAYQCEPSSTLSRCLRSPCLAAFFSIVPHETPLPEALIGAEDQIRSWRDERNWGHLDLNLVLFVDRLLSPEVVSGIRQNTTLCRKFVVAAPDAAAARHQLSSLPFSPLDTEGRFER